MAKGISERLAEQRLRIARDVEEIGDRNEVARKWGCSKTYIDKICREHGVAAHYIDQPSLCKIIYDVVNTTDTLRVIAERHGLQPCSLTRLHRYIKEAGFYSPRGRGRPKKL